MMICEKCGKKTNGKNGKCESCGHPVIYESSGRFLMRPTAMQMPSAEDGSYDYETQSKLPPKNILIAILAVAVVVSLFVGWFANTIIMGDGKGSCAITNEDKSDNSDVKESGKFSDGDKDVERKPENKHEYKYMKLEDAISNNQDIKGCENIKSDEEDGYVLLAKNKDTGISFGIYKMEKVPGKGYTGDGKFVADFGDLKLVDDKFIIEDESKASDSDDNNNKASFKNVEEMATAVIDNSKYLGDGFFAVSRTKKPRENGDWTYFDSEYYIVKEKSKVCLLNRGEHISNFYNGVALVCVFNADSREWKCGNLIPSATETRITDWPVPDAKKLPDIENWKGNDTIVIDGKEYDVKTFEEKTEDIQDEGGQWGDSK